MSSPESTSAPPSPLSSIETSRVVIRFAGDSGDGIQLTGSSFTTTAAIMGNRLASVPDYPAEIRAPKGTVAGVSGYQLQFASEPVYTPGDTLDALVAFNPAALKANLEDLGNNGLLILNEDEFNERALTKAGYDVDPRHDGSLDGFRSVSVPITDLTRKALVDIDMPSKDKDRCRNFFALGMAYWLYDRDPTATREWISEKFASKPIVIEANHTALKAGAMYCEVNRIFHERYHVPPATNVAGLYRHVSGNHATAMGVAVAGAQANKPIFYGSYPITPASDILHELASLRRFNVTTFQAEDEIAAIGSAIGAAFAGNLAVTGTSGPGMALKAEALNLALMTELPLVVVNVQRGGPSTGLPTKTEQSDLLQALYGRNGDAPVVVLAPMNPADCFHVAYDACRIAMKYMTPVIVLSDGYLANGSEPWLIPKVEDLAPIEVDHPTEDDAEGFLCYGRDDSTLARPWAVPGTPGLMHRLGGLEKEAGTGHVSSDADNHHEMTLTRQAKVDRVAQEIPPTEVFGDEQGGDLLVLGWGSTWGAIRSAVRLEREAGRSVSQVQLRNIVPFPTDLGDIIKRFDKVLIPEMNMGQLSLLIRAEFLVDAKGLNCVRGKPLTSQQVRDAITDLLDTEKGS